LNILRPADWEYCETARLDALVDGVEADGFLAVLFSTENYFAGRHGPELTLPQAPLWTSAVPPAPTNALAGAAP